jgi:tetratricopeptide (TPR) repeat protein
MTTPKKTCFVIMGFGVKVDLATGRKLNLDASYFNLIKPTVEDAGLECYRADEVVHSGNINVPMYERLLTSDLVIADLSTSNSNAFYELGVRHALRPYTTIIIAEEQFNFPFDIAQITVRKYKHLGDDIGVTEARRFRGELRAAIQTILARPADDSPVYTFLSRLRRLKLPDDLNAEGLGEAVPGAPPMPGARAAAPAPPPAPAAPGSAAPDVPTHSEMLRQVEEAKRRGDFAKARELLTSMRARMRESNPGRPEDPGVIQRLALVTYKSEQPTPLAALEEARALLATFNPETSNDTETLGLWGAVHKHLWRLLKDEAGGRAAQYLDQAVRGYERGFYLRNDYYNGINLAYVLNLRAANAASPEEAIADFVQARRVSGEVVEICKAWLDETEPPPADATEDEMVKYNESKYWVLATLAEAYVRLGDEPSAESYLRQAHALNPADWMKHSASKQLANLRRLLSDPPLKYVKTDAA